jgi:hypothetical protein
MSPFHPYHTVKTQSPASLPIPRFLALSIGAAVAIFFVCIAAYVYIRCCVSTRQKSGQYKDVERCGGIGVCGGSGQLEYKFANKKE